MGSSAAGPVLEAQGYQAPDSYGPAPPLSELRPLALGELFLKRPKAPPAA